MVVCVVGDGSDRRWLGHSRSDLLLSLSEHMTNEPTTLGATHRNGPALLRPELSYLPQRVPSRRTRK